MRRAAVETSLLAARALTRLLACLLLVGITGSARASDFWDEVRNPGLAQHRSELRRANAALRENRVELALAAAKRAIEVCRECADGYALLGRALAMSGDLAAANTAFAHALALAPDALDATEVDALLAASCALRVGEAERAADLLTRLLALGHDATPHARALAMLADALQLLGPEGLKRAVAVYGEAMRDEESRRTALLGFALALHRRGESAEAFALARRATEAEQSATAAWLPEAERAARQALWLSAIGDDHAAAQAWEHANQNAGPWAEHARRALEAARKQIGASP